MSFPTEKFDVVFRRESGRLVAMLARQFGPAHIDLAEDVAQEALLRALKHWAIKGVPDNPAAWLTTVAKNLALDALRRRQAESGRLQEAGKVVSSNGPTDERDRIALMLACCDPVLPLESQVALTLHMLGGMSSNEIASCLCSQPNAVEQRISRAKRRLRESDTLAGLPDVGECPERMEAVLLTLYQVFGAGYSAHSGRLPVRIDLCSDAIFLLEVLLRGPGTRTPEAEALMAVFLSFAARLPARTDDWGNVLRLEDQDRSLWDARLVSEAMRHFESSIRGAQLSRFHYEAAILMEHSRARSFEDTDWHRVALLYDGLLDVSPTKVVQLNRAIARGMCHGPEQAIRELDELGTDPVLARSPAYWAARGRFHGELFMGDASRSAYRRAAGFATNKAEREALLRLATG